MNEPKPAATRHRPVLLGETLQSLGPEAGGRFVDCTAGGGGHARALLERTAPDGRLLALDRDPESVRRLRHVLASYGARCEVVQANFADLAEVAAGLGWDGADGVFFDFGMSSDQVDDPARGFSFLQDGPLDMRMDRGRGETAADLLARLDPADLADLLRRFGEERSAGRIARAVVQARTQTPIETTLQLAGLVERAVGGRRGARIHPATRTFQALRIAVNGELEAVDRGLEAAVRLVRPGGRVAAISFHSLEDRRVKRRFAAHVGRDESLMQGGSRWQGEHPRAVWVVRRPVTAAPDELEGNPRARSAKLRAIERVE